jgi:hypothetical protein
MMSSGCEGVGAPVVRHAPEGAPVAVSPAAVDAPGGGLAPQPPGERSAPGERAAALVVPLAWVGQRTGPEAPQHVELSVSIVEVSGLPSRADVTSASYIMREGLPRDQAAHIIEAKGGAGHVALRVVKNTSEPEVFFALELPGRFDTSAFELAHGMVGWLRWDGAKPEVSVYDQRSKALVWSAAVDVGARKGPPRLAWHPAGELTVEWPGADGYKRVVYSGATGAVVRREALDARVEAVVADPVGYVLAAPAASPLLPSAGELGDCPKLKGNLRATRAVELEGLLMIVEATYPGGWRGDEAPALTRDNARCSSVRLVQLPGPLERGLWIMDAR